MPRIVRPPRPLGHLAALLASLLLACVRPTFALSLTDLGTLGGDNSSATAVSANGIVIVGGADRIPGASNSLRAFRRIGTSMDDLGTLGGNNAIAFATSADGSVIVGISTLVPGSNNFHAFRYSNGVMSDLGTLGGTNSTASGTSADGSIIVGFSLLAGDTAQHAFRYSNGTMVDLGTLGGNNSTAYAVSADGSTIVGEASTAGGGTHAFLHRNGAMADLGTLGGTGSIAYAVSADGTIVVGKADTAGGDSHAFRYSGGSMTDLGTLGGSKSSARGVSADGSVIVGTAELAGGATHAFRYANGSMSDLGTLGGRDSFAYGVSADGSVIVGLSYLPGDTVYHAFVYGGVMVDATNTAATMQGMATPTRELLALHAAELQWLLQRRCEAGPQRVCLTASTDYRRHGQTENSALTLTLGWQALPGMSLGLTLDQPVTQQLPDPYRSSGNAQPATALFASWQPRDDGLGWHARLALARMHSDVDATRPQLPYTEAGQGSSRVTGRAVSVALGYGFSTGATQWQPHVGVQHQRVERRAYTESGVVFPVHYDTVAHSETQADVGMRLETPLSAAWLGRADLSVSRVLSRRQDAFDASAPYLGSYRQDEEAGRRTRLAASLGVRYQPAPAYALHLALAWAQQADGHAASGISLSLSARF